MSRDNPEEEQEAVSLGPTHFQRRQELPVAPRARALGRLQRVSVQPPGEADLASDPDHASCWLWGLRPVAQPLGVSVSALAVLWVSGEGFSGIR